MPRGGRRTGTPGVAHGQRSDLNLPATAAADQPYGAAGQQLAAQQAVPLQRPPQPQPADARSAAQASPPLGGGLTPIDAPTERPNEPVTAGLNAGPGPGPEALALGGERPELAELRAIYAAFPNDGVRAVIEAMESNL